MASLHRSRPQGRPPSPKLPPSHKHPVSIPLETKEAAGSGASVPSLAPPEEPTLSDGPVRTEKGGWWTDGQVGSVPAWRRVVGNVSTEMHYVSLFLLKIYYKKTQLGEGHLPLCAKGWGRGSRGRQQLKGELAGITAGHHCRALSPTISRLCCCSWARSRAFSFFSSSICCLRSSLSICSRSASLKVSCMRWLV